MESTTLSNGTLGLLFLISVLAFVGLVMWLSIRGRSPVSSSGAGGGPLARHDPSDPWATISTSQMESDANSALIAADDAVKTSEQELSLTTARYGARATAEFSGAIAQSRADVMEAFRLRQLLDDDVVVNEAAKRARLREIIKRCRAADRWLDADVEAFDRFREPEARVGPMIEELTKRRDGVVARAPQMNATHNKLVDSYAASALLSVSDNSAQFAKRIMFADSSLASAREALTVGRRSEAAMGVRAAEEALGQAEMLLAGVATLTGQLKQARTSAEEQLSGVEADIVSAKGALARPNGGLSNGARPNGGPSTAGGIRTSAGAVDLTEAIAAAESTVASVRTDLATAKPDPFAALRRLEHVDERLSIALADVRDAAAQVGRARLMLETALPAAQAEVTAAENFITTRRGAIRAEARTRMAEARRHLDQADAMAETDPVAALSTAEQAESMAAAASRLASSDVAVWSEPRISGGAMGGFGGAVLGGILIDSGLARRRGGRGRRGYGRRGYDRGWYAGSDFGGSGFGWGGMMPGSFGGGRV